MKQWLKRPMAGSLTAIIILTATAMGAAAQDSLTAARDLYAAAAYEEALGVLNGLRASDRRPDESRLIEQYRAFCLLALGRASEADRVIEALVTAAPAYHPSEADVSPHVRSAFSDVRRRLLPGIIQRKYEEAKAAFDRRDRASAEGFQQVLDLLADSDLGSAASEPPLSELRTLAAGFRDLSATSAAPALPPALQLPQPLPPPTPVPSYRPTAPRIYSAGDPEVVPPSVVRQSFAPLAGVFALRPGVVEIVIDETGGVASATMSVPVNAVYDRVALATAKTWRYKPAMLNGAAVKFRQTIVLDTKTTR